MREVRKLFLTQGRDVHIDMLLRDMMERRKGIFPSFHTDEEHNIKNDDKMKAKNSIDFIQSLRRKKIIVLTPFSFDIDD